MVAVMTLTGSVIVDHFHQEQHDVFPIIAAHFVGMYALVIVTIGAVVLVTIPALWILRGGLRRDGSQMNKEGLGRRPCTSTRSWLKVEATR